MPKHEVYAPATPQAVNRGVAYLDAVGGGVITYATPQGQRVAAATGLTEILWPTEIATAKVSILDLGGE